MTYLKEQTKLLIFLKKWGYYKMYRTDMSKSVLMSYVLDIEKEVNNINRGNLAEQLSDIVDIIKNLKAYIKEG